MGMKPAHPPDVDTCLGTNGLRCPIDMIWAAPNISPEQVMDTVRIPQDPNMSQCGLSLP